MKVQEQMEKRWNKRVKQRELGWTILGFGDQPYIFIK